MRFVFLAYIFTGITAGTVFSISFVAAVISFEAVFGHRAFRLIV